MWATGFPTAALAWAGILYDMTINTALRYNTLHSLQHRQHTAWRSAKQRGLPAEQSPVQGSSTGAAWAGLRMLVSLPPCPVCPFCSKVLAVCLISLACIVCCVLCLRTVAGILRLKVFIPEHKVGSSCLAVHSQFAKKLPCVLPGCLGAEIAAVEEFSTAVPACLAAWYVACGAAAA
jgi:hypothetical protein